MNNSNVNQMKQKQNRKTMNSIYKRVRTTNKFVQCVAESQLREVNEGRIIDAIAKDNDMQPQVVAYNVNNFKKLGHVDRFWKTDVHSEYIIGKKEENRVAVENRDHKKIYSDRKSNPRYSDRISIELINEDMLASMVLIYLVSGGHYADKIWLKYNIGKMQCSRIFNKLFTTLEYNGFRLIDRNEINAVDIMLSVKYYKYIHAEYTEAQIVRLDNDLNFQERIKQYGSNNLILTYEYIRRRCIDLLNINRTAEKTNKSVSEWIGV